ncbi:MAG: ATP-dependent DNA helicase RecG [Acidaminobacteraceae bacterium]
MKLEDSLLALKGVGAKKFNLLNNLGLYTINDMLMHYPRTYVDRSKVYTLRDADDKSIATFKFTIYDIEKSNSRGKSLLKLYVKDDNDTNCEIIFFNAKFLESKFKVACIYYFYGQINKKFSKCSMTHPDFTSEMSDTKFLRIEPVYNLTAGINNAELVRMSEQIFKNIKIEDDLHRSIIERNKLCDKEYAIYNLHFPKGRKELKIAKYRLIFEEFFNLTIGLILLKSDYSIKRGVVFEENSVDLFLSKLPFTLSGAQSKVWNQIYGELCSDKRVNRLIQGDVGSGKTVIAMLAMYLAKLSGYQSALMAPTEILAKQHYKSFKEFFSEFNITIEVLTGSTKAKDKLTDRLKNGEIDILIGTHALLEDHVQFENIGLIITDEQHRFGVRQRNVLSSKGDDPNILIMSATPIPRTLSLVIYGDVDISVIDQMPSGRKEIKTHYISKSKEKNMYEFIREELIGGRQAYFVCPLIEDSEKLDLNSAESLYSKLSEKIFKEFEVGLVHGKMKGKEKEEIMNRFATNKINVLVSTTVIEVGINVPNSSIMVVSDSNRFGLSQLHQLRGRVGRGVYQSYCFLLSESLGRVAKERINAMVDSSDGFKIAELDLKLRGPGELLGIRQHGVPELRVADIIRHQSILETVQQEVKYIINNSSKNDANDLKLYIEILKEKIFKDFTI